MRYRPLLLLFLVAAGSLGGYALGSHGNAGARVSSSSVPTAASAASPRGREQPAPQVRLQAVSRQPWQHSLPLQGKLRAQRSVQLASESSGRLLQGPPVAGQPVHQGQVLLQLDDAATRAALAEARVFLQNEQRKLDDMQRLAGKGVVSRNDLNNQQAVVAQAAARLARVEVDQQRMQVQAPFAGRLGLYDVSPGQWLAAGSAVLTLDDLARVQLDLAVPEVWLASLQPGQAVEGRVDAWPAQRFHGQLLQRDSRIDEATLTVRVRLQFDNPQQLLLPGMLMRVALPVSQQQAVVIPPQAVGYQGTERFVFVFDPPTGSVQRRVVVLGSSAASEVVVLDGLQPGEQVVIEGAQGLQDGQRVRPLGSGNGHGPGTGSALGTGNAPATDNRTAAPGGRS